MKNEKKEKKEKDQSPLNPDWERFKYEVAQEFGLSERNKRKQQSRQGKTDR